MISFSSNNESFLLNLSTKEKIKIKNSQIDNNYYNDFYNNLFVFNDCKFLIYNLNGDFLNELYIGDYVQTFTVFKNKIVICKCQINIYEIFILTIDDTCTSIIDSYCIDSSLYCSNIKIDNNNIAWITFSNGIYEMGYFNIEKSIKYNFGKCYQTTPIKFINNNIVFSTANDLYIYDLDSFMLINQISSDTYFVNNIINNEENICIILKSKINKIFYKMEIYDKEFNLKITVFCLNNFLIRMQYLHDILFTENNNEFFIVYTSEEIRNRKNILRCNIIIFNINTTIITPIINFNYDGIAKIDYIVDTLQLW